MRYVALLRGINVGGNTMVSMEKLKATFEALGFESVKTYINSGNVAFDSAESDAESIEIKLRQGIAEQLEKDIPVMVRSAVDIQGILEQNPFAGAVSEHKKMHVFFLERELTPDEMSLLMHQASHEEQIAVAGRAVYHLVSGGVSDSVLGKGFIDKKLKIAATARNWRTTERLATL